MRPKASLSPMMLTSYSLLKALSVVKEQAGCRCGALRVLNSDWVGVDSTYKFFEAILTDPFRKGIRSDTHCITEQSTSVGRCER